MDEKKLGEVCKTIMEIILKAHVSKNYELLSSCFSDNPGEGLPPEQEFNQAVSEVIEPLGNMISMSYLGTLNKKEEKVSLWKTVFEKGEKELLWKLYLNDSSNEIKVKGLWFG